MFPVDLPGQSAQLRFELLIFLYIFAAWNGNLDEDDFVLQLWVIIEKGVETLEFLGEAFDVIQPIHANNYFNAFVTFFEVPNAVLDLRLFQCIGELLGVNTDNKFVNTNETISILDLVGNLGACLTRWVLISISELSELLGGMN